MVRMVSIWRRKVPLAVEEQTEEWIPMREHSIIYEDKEGLRYKVKQLVIYGKEYRFFQDARNVVLKEIWMYSV